MRNELRIPIEECKHNHLYRISSRNLILGVWDADKKWFTGIREKFGQRFLDEEYHWDHGHGTAHPKDDLGPIPEGMDEKQLFAWLAEREEDGNETGGTTSPE